jgi:hypothetical protein
MTKVAANLADLCPAGFLEGFRGFFAGDVG